MQISKQILFEQLPPEWPDDLLPSIQVSVSRSPLKLVVLDDDPTGTQTMHDISVLTVWDADTLTQALQEPDSTIYLLTNSRSLPLESARSVNREIAENLELASQITGRPFSIVSRSDSTLRGHFPGEVEVLVDALHQTVDGILILPFFEEGGRFTINDIHFVAQGNILVPVGETEYARDATFGYHSSNLREWVIEKSGGWFGIDDVASISLRSIRQGGPGAVQAVLMQLEKDHICVVNCASYRDMEVIVTGLLAAEDAGKHFLVRSAASFVRVRSGQAAAGMLTRNDLVTDTSETGGLIVAGSYIQKSSQQIAALQELPNLFSLEVSVSMLLEENPRQMEIERVSRAADQALAQGQDVLIYTSRKLVTSPDPGESLRIGQSVSESLVQIVRRIHNRPAWVIAKGGITSSDVATKGLSVCRARVLGQILPGVPVWRTQEESRWPGMIYVVFPGNVGDQHAIAEAVKILHGGESCHR